MSGEQGGVPVLYIRQQQECRELCLGVDNELAESLWVKAKGHTKMTDVLGVRHHPPDKEEIAEAFFRHMEEAFFRHMEEASHLHVLVLISDFNFPDTCWRHYAAGKKQFRFVISLLLECIDNSFRTPVIKELTRGGNLLDLMLTSKEELVRGTNEGCLACRKHKMVEFRILWGKNKEKWRWQI